MGKTRIFIALMFVVPVFLISVSPTYAADPLDALPASCKASEGTSIEECFTALAKLSTNFVAGIAVIIALFFLPYIGMLMASEDPTKIQKGKELLIAWVSGFLIIVFAGTLVYIISKDILKIY